MTPEGPPGSVAAYLAHLGPSVADVWVFGGALVLNAWKAELPKIIGSYTLN